MVLFLLPISSRDLRVALSSRQALGVRPVPQGGEVHNNTNYNDDQDNSNNGNKLISMIVMTIR